MVAPFVSRVLRYQPLWVALGLMMVIFVIIASLVSISQPVNVPGIDKFHHLLAYGAMMAWWGMVQPRWRIAWALALLLLGAALEWAQSMTGHRFMDRWDMLANALGVALAFGLLFTPLSGLLAWFDRFLADRLDARAS